MEKAREKYRSYEKGCSIVETAPGANPSEAAIEACRKRGRAEREGEERFCRERFGKRAPTPSFNPGRGTFHRR